MLEQLGLNLLQNKQDKRPQAKTHVNIPNFSINCWFESAMWESFPSLDGMLENWSVWTNPGQIALIRTP